MSEAFIIDSNILIGAYNVFGMDTMPRFWDTLKEKIISHEFVLLDVVKDEINNGKDSLVDWVNSFGKEHVFSHIKNDILIRYSEIQQYIQDNDSYSDSSKTNWSNERCADPWIVATAIAENFTIVTNEKINHPSGTPSNNPKIPTIASVFGVKTMLLQEMMKQLNIIWT